MRSALTICVLAVLWSLPAMAGELVGEGQHFIRLTNTRPDDARLLVRVNIVPNDAEPFDWKGKLLYLGRDGEHDNERVPAEQWLAPGQSTPWIDIGRYMTLRGARSPEFYLSPVLCGVMSNPPSDGLHLIIEVARGPGIKITRRIQINRPEIAFDGPWEAPWRLGYGAWALTQPILPTVGLMIPTRKEHPLRVYTFEEAIQWQLDIIEDFPAFGRRPEQIVFTTAGRPEIKQALGYNGFPPGTVVASLGDEINLALETPREEQDRRFREQLKARGFDPLDLIATGQLEAARALPPAERWQFVHVLPPLPDRPVQFYESANFRYALWHEELGAKARKAEAAHPLQRVLAGANFTPAGCAWPDVRHWISPFKSNQLTMCWTEDWWWAIADPTPQTYGFLLDAFRLAGSYHGAPIQFYVMPFKGQAPDHFRRMNALALAHGAKILNHFHTEDQSLTTWDYIDLMNSPPMYQAIYDVIHEVGAVENRLYPAMPQRAEVAIMLSRAGDTWDTEDIGGAGNLTDAQYNVNSYERKALWLALRQAQIPVDLITDEDIAEGRLAPYRVLYLVGSEMLAGAADPLKAWVRDGGIVYATGGCGLLDEYRRPIQTLREMYGIADHELVRKERQIHPRVTLPKTPVLDTLTLSGGGPTEAELPLEAVCYREVFTPLTDATVVGTYAADGAVGAVLNRYGQGRALCVGALAGLAYLKPAMIPEPATLPTAFRPAHRALLTTPARWAGVVPPIQADDPLVETQYMTGPEGAIAILINWRQQPIDELRIRFPGLKAVKSVRSLRKAGFFQGRLEDQPAGKLEVRTEQGIPEVRLRLEITDYLLID